MIRTENKAPAKMLRRVLALSVALLTLFGCFTVSAADIEEVPYYSYCYWEGPSRYEAVPMRAMYEPYAKINGDSLGIPQLANAEHIALSHDAKELYILDSGNSRLVIVDTEDFSLIKTIGEIKHNGKKLNYEKAKGIYVSKNNQIYISDTENHRVLVTDKSGKLIKTFVKPNEVGVPEDLDFRPTRVTMDSKGYVYVISNGCYYGMLVYNQNGKFLGFHGSYVVEQSVVDTIKGWVTGLFMTNEKSEVSQKKLPAEILDIAIDNNNMLYTLSGTGYGQIKRLGLNGNQTLNHKFGFQSQSGDLINFGENPMAYWHKKQQYTLSFNGITVDPQGFIYAVDQSRGRIFMYDEECRLISAFGTGFSEGDQVGTFLNSTAIASSQDRLYVLDYRAGSVTVFGATDYCKMFKEADVLTIDGEYDKALLLWQQVSKLDANNQRAYEGIGKAMLNQEDYEGAMKYAELGNDQQTYSQAYKVVQKEWLTRNFWWVFLLCLAGVGGIAALLVMSKKKKIFEIKNAKLRTALSVPIHPIQAFNSMKFQNNTSVILAVVFIVVFYLAKVSQDLYGGFMYVITDTSNYNALFTLIGSVGVLLLWVIVNWGICILNEGKGTLKEVFCMSAYSVTPLIVYSVIFTAASHLIPATTTSTFALLSTIMMIYTVLLLLLGMTVVYEYSFFKAMWMAVLSILGMLLAAFVIFSVVLLTQQFVTFFVNVFDEIMLR